MIIILHYTVSQVVLKEHQTLEEGQQIAFNLMDKLGISKSDLISTAYADLLENRK